VSRARRLAAWALLAALAPARAGAADEPRPTRTLAECVELALAAHPTLGSAAARVESGRQRVLATRAAYLPQLDAGWASNRGSSGFRGTSDDFDDDIDDSGFGGGSERSWFHNAGFSLSQLLFDFGQNLDAMRAARARREALAADEATARETITFEVKRSYFELLAARRLLAVAEETLRSNRQQLELAQGRYDVGLAARIDVTRSDVQLANAELDRITAQNNVAVAEDTLRNAIGLAEPIDFEIADVLEAQRVTLSEEAALDTAYRARPELAGIEAQGRALESEIRVRQKNHLPILTGEGGYDWAGDEFPLSAGWSVGARLRFPLFSGGRTHAEVAEAQADLRALRSDTEALRQDIALEVRRALLELTRTAQSLDVTQRGSQQARENLALAEGRYSTGVGSIIELTDAQAQRARAEADHVRALYSHQLSLAALERAIGAPVVQP
jgi:outer membrane protein TolC